MDIKKIGAESLEALKNASAYGLPDRPSERGMSAADIKKAFYKPFLDAGASLAAELNRIVEEANQAMSKASSEQGAVNSVFKEDIKAINNKITKLQEEYSAFVPNERSIAGLKLKADITAEALEAAIGLDRLKISHRELDSRVITLSSEVENIKSRLLELIYDYYRGTDGIAYEIAPDGMHCICTGLGTVIDTSEIEIAGYFGGLPVTEIGEGAFRGVTVASLSVPSTVNKFGRGAFDGASVDKLYIENLSSWLESEFGEASTPVSENTEVYIRGQYLTDLAIPSDIAVLKKAPLENFKQFGSVSLPNGIKSIEAEAFAGLNILEIYLPWNEGEGSLSGAPFGAALATVFYDSLRPTKGLAYELSSDGSYYSCTGLGSAAEENIVIEPEIGGLPVKAIGTAAFYYGKIRSIVIPRTVEIINGAAFYKCSKLNKVIFAEDGKLKQIGEDAFCDCIALTSFEIPETVEDINSKAFLGCNKLVEIYNKSAFNAEGLSGSVLNIYTPESGESRLDCSEDGYVFYADGDTVYLLGYCGADKDIRLPDDYNGRDYDIYKYAFYGSDLTEIKTADCVKTIGFKAFEACRALLKVTFGEESRLESIESYAFQDCVSLEKTEFPRSLTSIDRYAFTHCEKLRYSFKDTEHWFRIAVDYEGGTAEDFIRRENGTLVDVNNLSDRLNSEGPFCYFKLTGEDKLTVSVDEFIGKTYTLEVYKQQRYDISEPVHDKSEYKLLGWFDEEGHEFGAKGSWTYGEGKTLTARWLEEIKGVFNSYDNGSGKGVYVTGRISDGKLKWQGIGKFGNTTYFAVTSEDPYAVENEAERKPYSGVLNNPAGTKYIFEAKLTYISDGSEGYDGNSAAAFMGFVNTNKKTNYMNCDNPSCYYSEFVYTDESYINLYGEMLKADRRYTVRFEQTVGEDIIDIYIDGRHVKTCTPRLNYPANNQGDCFGFAFYLRTSTLNMTFDDTYCGVWRPLEERPELATEGLAYTLSDDGTYYSCSGIGTATDKDILIASEYNGLPVTRIKAHAFSSCLNLTSIIIPNSITSIGSSAFYKCSGLTSITIPDSVISIGNYAFVYCTGLTSVTFEGTPNNIGPNLFGGGIYVSNQSISDIYVPWSEETIEGAPWGATNATVNYKS